MTDETLSFQLPHNHSTWADHIFLVMGYYIFTPLFFKSSNLNNFQCLCDCHSPRFPITMKQFSVLDTTGCFPTDPRWIITWVWSWFVWNLGGHSFPNFENECSQCQCTILDRQQNACMWVFMMHVCTYLHNSFLFFYKKNGIKCVLTFRRIIIQHTCTEIPHGVYQVCRHIWKNILLKVLPNKSST